MSITRIKHHLRRQERLERRVDLMRRFKNKLGMMFHNLHHHHHFEPSGSKEGGGGLLFSRDVHGRDHHRLSVGGGRYGPRGVDVRRRWWPVAAGGGERIWIGGEEAEKWWG